MTVTWSQLGTYRWQQLAAQTWGDPLPGDPALASLLGPDARALLEFAFGADLTANPNTWAMTDVTADLRHNPGVSIGRGRPDEASQCQPATMTFVLGNSSGNYTARRAMSDYYPYMRQGLPVRFCLDPGTGRKERFAGFVDTITPGWDITGTSRTAIVTVTASGILRRLGQGVTPVKSPLRQFIGDLDELFAWWSLEDGPFATSLTSEIAGVPAMTYTGGVTPGSAGPIGGLSAVGFDATGVLHAVLPAPTETVTGWRIVIAYNPAGTSVNFTYPIAFRDSAGNVWSVSTDLSGGFTEVIVGLWDGGTSFTGSTVFNHNYFDGDWHALTIEMQQNGADIDLYVGDDESSFTSVPAAFTGRTLGYLSEIWVNGQANAQIKAAFGASGNSGTVAHLFVQQPFTGDHFIELLGPIDAWDGEDAVDRLERLCGYEGVPLTTIGFTGISTPMGVQPTGTFFALIRQIEATEGGVLSDGTNFGLSYEVRAHRYNQTVKIALDIAAGDVAYPFQPVDDDQKIRNDVTVNQTADLTGSATGSGVHVADNASIAAHGKYDTTISVNTDGTVDLTSIGTWALHRGTLDVTRYPNLPLDLAASPDKVADWLNVVEGSRSTVTNLPTEASDGDVDNIIEGYSEKITVTDWDVSTNCSPAAGWEVGVVDDATHGVVGADGAASLVADISDSDTALTVAVDAEPWTTTAGDFPLDIAVGGEQITLSAITSWLVDAFGRTSSSSWGSADTGQSYTNTGGSASDFSVGSGTGQHSMGSVNSSRWSTVTAPSADVDLYVSVSTSVLATGGSHFVALVARFADTSNTYLARLDFSITQTVTLTIRKRVGGTETSLGSLVVPGLTHAANTLFRLRLRVNGSTLQAKAWLDSGIEPEIWQVTVTDTDLTAAGSVGVRSILSSANTNTLPVTVKYDSLALVDPQTFTVSARSVNNVVKGHSAGDDVDVWDTAVVAL